jgi:hypothetical protein
LDQIVSAKLRKFMIGRELARQPVEQPLWVPGTQGGSRRLPGGAEGIRTDSHRGRSESSYSSLRRSMGAACSGRAPSRSRRALASRSLDALNSLLADVRRAQGPSLNVFLITQQHWSQTEVGWITTISGRLLVADNVGLVPVHLVSQVLCVRRI